MLSARCACSAHTSNTGPLKTPNIYSVLSQVIVSQFAGSSCETCPLHLPSHVLRALRRSLYPSLSLVPCHLHLTPGLPLSAAILQTLPMAWTRLCMRCSTRPWTSLQPAQPARLVVPCELCVSMRNQADPHRLLPAHLTARSDTTHAYLCKAQEQSCLWEPCASGACHRDRRTLHAAHGASHIRLTCCSNCRPTCALT